MRTARDVPTPLLCKNSMISRITLCSAQPAMMRSARFAATRYRGKARRTLGYGTVGLAVDDVAIGAPLARELRALLDVGPDGVRGNQGKR